jgi:hypothetical protein
MLATLATEAAELIEDLDFMGAWRQPSSAEREAALLAARQLATARRVYIAYHREPGEDAAFGADVERYCLTLCEYARADRWLSTDGMAHEARVIVLGREVRTALALPRPRLVAA